MKMKLIAGFGAAALLVAATTGVASAAPPETTDGFVCPVLGGQAGVNGNGDGQPFVQIFDGDYTLIGPEVTVPIHATNGDGAGAPGGPHSSPGDTDYTAIWAGN